MDTDGSDQRKSFDATHDTHVNDVAVMNSTRSVNPQASANSDPQALNLSTSTATSVSLKLVPLLEKRMIIIIHFICLLV